MTGTQSAERGSRCSRWCKLCEGLQAHKLVLLLLWGFVLFCLRDAEATAKIAGEALRFCGRRLLPALFPMAAVGGLLTLFPMPLTFLVRPVGRLFRLSDGSVGVLFLSLLSGFPVGAMLAARLFAAGRIGREEADRLTCFTNNASAAFLVGCVGSGFFGDPLYGWILWGASVTAALTVGWIMGRGALPSLSTGKADAPALSPADIAASLKATATGMLYLAAFVTFFAVLTAFLQSALAVLLPAGRPAEALAALLSAFFELTGGLSAIAALPISLVARLGLAGAATGFGGLSVYFQCVAAALPMASAATASPAPPLPAGRAAVERRLLLARLAIAPLSGLLAAVGVFLAALH